MGNSVVIAASANGDAGRSTQLAASFIEALPKNEGVATLHLLSSNPPPPLDALFVESSFSDPDRRTSAMRNALAYSDKQIDALRKAVRLVIATPMYNFGMPGLLKSWFDQIVRPNETFTMTGDSQAPYRGLLSPRQCIVITTRGSSAFSPSGPAAEWNLLDKHLCAILGLIGIAEIEYVDCPGLDEDKSEVVAQYEKAQARLRALASL